jgi:hypothetical protein
MMSDKVTNSVHLIKLIDEKSATIGIQNDGELGDTFIESLPAQVECWGKSPELGERIYTISEPAYGRSLDKILGVIIIFMSGDVVRAIDELNHFRYGPIPDRD